RVLRHPGDNRLHGGNFISTFVLIAQNRMSAAADKRAVLDLQIGLLTEHELTKIATLLSGMAKQLGVRTEVEGELEEVKRMSLPMRCLTRSKTTQAESLFMRANQKQTWLDARGADLA